MHLMEFFELRPEEKTRAITEVIEGQEQGYKLLQDAIYTKNVVLVRNFLRDLNPETILRYLYADNYALIRIACDLKVFKDVMQHMPADRRAAAVVSDNFREVRKAACMSLDWFREVMKHMTADERAAAVASDNFQAVRNAALVSVELFREVMQHVLERRAAAVASDNFRAVRNAAYVSVELFREVMQHVLGDERAAAVASENFEAVRAAAGNSVEIFREVMQHVLGDERAAAVASENFEAVRAAAYDSVEMFREVMKHVLGDEQAAAVASEDFEAVGTAAWVSVELFREVMQHVLAERQADAIVSNNFRALRFAAEVSVEMLREVMKHVQADQAEAAIEAARPADNVIVELFRYVTEHAPVDQRADVVASVVAAWDFKAVRAAAGNSIELFRKVIEYVPKAQQAAAVASANFEAVYNAACTSVELFREVMKHVLGDERAAAVASENFKAVRAAAGNSVEMFREVMKHVQPDERAAAVASWNFTAVHKAAGTSVEMFREVMEYFNDAIKKVKAAMIALPFAKDPLVRDVALEYLPEHQRLLIKKAFYTKLELEIAKQLVAHMYGYKRAKAEDDPLNMLEYIALTKAGAITAYLTYLNAAQEELPKHFLWINQVLDSKEKEAVKAIKKQLESAPDQLSDAWQGEIIVDQFMSFMSPQDESRSARATRDVAFKRVLGRVIRVPKDGSCVLHAIAHVSSRLGNLELTPVDDRKALSSPDGAMCLNGDKVKKVRGRIRDYLKYLCEEEGALTKYEMRIKDALDAEEDIVQGKKSRDQYLDAILLEGTYLGRPEILALGVLYKLDISVYGSDGTLVMGPLGIAGAEAVDLCISGTKPHLQRYDALGPNPTPSGIRAGGAEGGHCDAIEPWYIGIIKSAEGLANMASGAANVGLQLMDFAMNVPKWFASELNKLANHACDVITDEDLLSAVIYQLGEYGQFIDAKGSLVPVPHGYHGGPGDDGPGGGGGAAGVVAAAENSNDGGGFLAGNASSTNASSIIGATLDLHLESAH